MTSHAFDFSLFSTQVEQAARSAFQELAAAHPAESLCAFALYSDDGAMTVCPSTNTRAHLESKLKAFPDDAAYYTFAPAEWALEAKGASVAVEELCTALRTHVMGIEDDEDAFEAFRSDLAEACIAALERLRREGFFEQTAGGAVLLLFQASAGDPEIAAERRMIERLNDAPIVQQHHRWTETWG